MKIQTHRYQLKPKSASQTPRMGALLKVTFPDQFTGYADCHPWPELGDLSLNEQLESLYSGNPTPLINRSLHYARLDAEARTEKRSLLEVKRIPESHFLVLDTLYPNYPVIKVKAGNDPEREAQQLNQLAGNTMKIRLDCNEKFTERQFEAFLHAIKPVRQLIDYIEDPFPYSPGCWKRVRERFGISIACDRKVSQAVAFPDSYDVLIWKPAIEEKPAIANGKRLVVTSYLDHPLGQAVAMYEAARYCADEVCGLDSHLVYEPGPFSQALRKPGTGFGFDTLLENLEWENGKS